HQERCPECRSHRPTTFTTPALDAMKAKNPSARMPTAPFPAPGTQGSCLSGNAVFCCAGAMSLLREFLRRRRSTFVVGPCASELGTQQHGGGGVVDPKQQHDHRSRGTITGCGAALAEVQADQLLADSEYAGCGESAHD